MYEFFFLLAGVIFVCIQLAKDATADAHGDAYSRQLHAEHKFNWNRQLYLSNYLSDSNKCKEMIGVDYHTFQPYDNLGGSNLRYEQIQMAVRIVARREGWDYYDIPLYSYEGNLAKNRKPTAYQIMGLNNARDHAERREAYELKTYGHLSQEHPADKDAPEDDG